jgi:hypothetical protein
MVLGLMAAGVRLAFRSVFLLVGIVVLIAGGFVYFKGNQPMGVSQVPSGITYWQFIADRLDAAGEVVPERCGVGRLVTFAVLAPVYSIVYTDVGLHPDGFLARVSENDGNIPKGVENTRWYDVPNLWWRVVEKISWSMLARHTPVCNFRPVRQMNAMK